MFVESWWCPKGWVMSHRANDDHRGLRFRMQIFITDTLIQRKVVKFLLLASFVYIDLELVTRNSFFSVSHVVDRARSWEKKIQYDHSFYLSWSTVVLLALWSGILTSATFSMKIHFLRLCRGVAREPSSRGVRKADRRADRRERARWSRSRWGQARSLRHCHRSLVKWQLLQTGNAPSTSEYDLSLNEGNMVRMN